MVLKILINRKTNQIEFTVTPFCANSENIFRNVTSHPEMLSTLIGSKIESNNILAFANLVPSLGFKIVHFKLALSAE